MTFTLKSEIESWPKRIICLTAETTEIAFALGAGQRIVGVSGYSVRPPEARQKEKVAAFTSVRMDKIRALKPDLILGFSDLQKDILRDLVGEGYNVFVTNQRSLAEIGEAILAIGRLLGEEQKAVKICRDFYAELDTLALKASETTEGKKPRVYFEEWDDPLISGISWVSELIERLGGEDVFKEKSSGKVARERTVSSEDVIRANPDRIIASWCGKKVQFEKIKSRAGWENIKAVHDNRLYEIKSADILQPGLSLLEGARQIAAILKGEEETVKTVDGFCQSG
ncbi:MAG: cobalamin-binding protein [Candidatus Omnitrophica bacterium]|nr:cobalamin-binding protein [Candidatus Omnitrophota bacterium]